jgi:hypothetical protein
LVWPGARLWSPERLANVEPHQKCRHRRKRVLSPTHPSLQHHTTTDRLPSLCYGIHYRNPFAQAHGMIGTNGRSGCPWNIPLADHFRSPCPNVATAALVPLSSRFCCLCYINRIAQMINNRLLSTLRSNPGSTTLHIHGHRTLQKKNEHRRRDAEQHKRVTYCLSISSSYQALANTGSKKGLKT